MFPPLAPVPPGESEAMGPPTGEEMAVIAVVDDKEASTTELAPTWLGTLEEDDDPYAEADDVGVVTFKAPPV